MGEYNLLGKEKGLSGGTVNSAVNGQVGSASLNKRGNMEAAIASLNMPGCYMTLCLSY